MTGPAGRGGGGAGGLQASGPAGCVAAGGGTCWAGGSRARLRRGGARGPATDAGPGCRITPATPLPAEIDRRPGPEQQQRRDPRQGRKAAIGASSGASASDGAVLAGSRGAASGRVAGSEGVGRPRKRIDPTCVAVGGAWSLRWRPVGPARRRPAASRSAPRLATFHGSSAAGGCAAAGGGLGRGVTVPFRLKFESSRGPMASAWRSRRRCRRRLMVECPARPNGAAASRSAAASPERKIKLL